MVNSSENMQQYNIIVGWDFKVKHSHVIERHNNDSYIFKPDV